MADARRWQGCMAEATQSSTTSILSESRVIKTPGVLCTRPFSLHLMGPHPYGHRSPGCGCICPSAIYLSPHPSLPKDTLLLAGAHSSNLTAEALRRYTSDQDTPPPQCSKDTSVNLPAGADRDADDWHTTRSLSNLVFPSGDELSRDEQKETQAPAEQSTLSATGGDL